MRELSGHLSNVVHRQTIRDAECVARETARAKSVHCLPQELQATIRRLPLFPCGSLGVKCGGRHVLLRDPTPIKGRRVHELGTRRRSSSSFAVSINSGLGSFSPIHTVTLRSWSSTHVSITNIET